MLGDISMHIVTGAEAQPRIYCGVAGLILQDIELVKKIIAIAIVGGTDHPMDTNHHLALRTAKDIQKVSAPAQKRRRL